MQDILLKLSDCSLKIHLFNVFASLQLDKFRLFLFFGMQVVNPLFSHINYYRFILKIDFRFHLFHIHKTFYSIQSISFHFFVLLQMQDDYGFLSTAHLGFRILDAKKRMY